MRVLLLVLIAVLAAPLAHAQRASRDLITRYEAMVGEVESSTLNAALPLFGDLFWAYRPVQVTGAGPGELDPESSDPGIASKIANESLQRNLPALERYVQGLCRRLTPQQVTFLEDYAKARYAALVAEYATRKPAIAAAMGAPTDRFDPATVQFRMVNDCANSAESGPGVINISRELVLTALMSSMLVDAQLYIIPEASLDAMQEGVKGARGQVDPARSGPLLERVRQTAVWKNFVRARRALQGDQTKPLDRFEEEDIFVALQSSRPDCAQNAVRCRVMLATAYAFLSANKFDYFFRQQMDFILAHEIGHHALGHTALPNATCAVEQGYELAADSFAVGLTRPADGLFAPKAADVASGTVAGFAETRFASGIDLFMVQSHRIAGLSDSDGCFYPTFAQRHAAARTFEAAKYPLTRAQAARFATRSVAGTWQGVFLERGDVVRIVMVLQDTPTGGFSGLMTEFTKSGEFTSFINGRARLNGQIAFQKTYDGKNGRAYGVAHSGHLLGPNTMAGQWRLADGARGSFSFDRAR